MPIPDGSVIITPRQMYDKLEETHKAVEQLVNTVNPALTDIRSDASELKGRVDAAVTDAATLKTEHGNRLTAIETRNMVLATIGGILTVIFGGSIGVVIAHVWH